MRECGRNIDDFLPDALCSRDYSRQVSHSVTLCNVRAGWEGPRSSLGRGVDVHVGLVFCFAWGSQPGFGLPRACGTSFAAGLRPRHARMQAAIRGEMALPTRQAEMPAATWEETADAVAFSACAVATPVPTSAGQACSAVTGCGSLSTNSGRAALTEEAEFPVSRIWLPTRHGGLACGA